MLSKGRVTAPALVTLALAASLVVTGCASHSGTDISTAGPVSGRAGRTVELTGATLVSDGDAPRLLLSGSAPLTPTVFSRDDGKRVVVDLSDTVVAAGLEPPRPARGTTSVISKVTMRSFSELGKPHIQFELVGSEPFLPKVEAGVNASGALAVVFERKVQLLPAPTVVATASSAPKPEPVQPAFEPSVSAPPTPTVPSETDTVKTASLSPTAPDVAVPEKQHFVTQAATGHAASRLQAVSARKSGSGLVVQLAGSGQFGYEAFLLANPPRWVVDLPGVRNGAVPKTQEIRGGPVTRVRVSQFRNEPAAVTRVVFDLAEGVIPELRQNRTGLAVAFRAVGTAPPAQVAGKPAPLPIEDTPSKPDVVAAIRPVPSAVPAAGSYEAHEVDDQTEKVVPPAPAPAVAATNAAATTSPEAAPAAAVAVMPLEGSAEPPVAISAAAEPPAEGPIEVMTVSVAPSEPEKPVASQASSETPVHPVPQSAPALIAPKVVQANAEIRVVGKKDAKAVPAVALPVVAGIKPLTPPRKAKSSSSDRALVEAAEALLLQQDGSGLTKDLGNPYEARVMGSTEKQYTGEPITLNLKDADVKDTLQKFSELTGLNIVLDPEVRGTVTVSLTDIPWDQALELILKINGLGYTLEGNVMRIATTGKLAGEEGQKRALLTAQEQNRPVKTIIQKLSYAEGGRMVEAIKKVMTARGDVYVDNATNNLIIKELPENIPVILDLIRNLDIAPLQVMIEARIVEATRTFVKQLGVNWAFTGAADAAHGNTTGLVFPNNMNVGGQVSLPAGTNLLNIAMGNVLDTFKLDFALSAAESRGLVKVISSPKIVTTQLQTASIQSGFQIPIQTTVNNTTSVLYIDATTRLDVMPFITAEGTIMMTITIQRREPAVGINIAAGTNVPLITRDAKTKLLVRDGGTAVIGGIMKLSTNDAKNVIPGLWKIPILGNLFKNLDYHEDSDELMIFITPRIVKNT